MLAALVLPVWTVADRAPAKQSALRVPQHLAKARRLNQESRVDNFGGKQRYQTHPGIHVDVVHRTVGGHHDVLEESGFGIPERRSSRLSFPCDGFRDREELQVALDGDALVVGILGAELAGYHGHVERNIAIQPVASACFRL